MLMKRAFDIFSFFCELVFVPIYAIWQPVYWHFYTFLQKVPQNFNQASCFKFHQSLAGVYVISLVSAGFGACIG